MTHHTMSRCSTTDILRVVKGVFMKEMFYLPMHSSHFYLLLYGVGHMIKERSDSDSTYHSLCYTSHGALAGTKNSSMGRSTMKDRPDDPSHTLLTQN